MVSYLRTCLLDFDIEIARIEKEMERKGIENRPLKRLKDYFESMEELEQAGIVNFNQLSQQSYSLKTN